MHDAARKYNKPFFFLNTDKKQPQRVGPARTLPETMMCDDVQWSAIQQITGLLSLLSLLTFVGVSSWGYTAHWFQTALTAKGIKCFDLWGKFWGRSVNFEIDGPYAATVKQLDFNFYRTG